jgi:hypothetical protein
MIMERDICEEARASARGFFQRKSQLALVANGVQNPKAIHRRSSERGILAFSREPMEKTTAGFITLCNLRRVLKA